VNHQKSLTAQSMGVPGLRLTKTNHARSAKPEGRTNSSSLSLSSAEDADAYRRLMMPSWSSTMRQVDTVEDYVLFVKKCKEIEDA